MVTTDILILFLLVLINGFFAMSELAVVSARRARLQAMARAGSAGADTAVRLSEEPGRFLSSVQIGITVIGIFAGAYGEAALAKPLAGWLGNYPSLAPYSYGLALAIVVASITYLSLIFGELVPKQLALANAERIATLVAPPMRLLATISAPLVFVLDASSAFVLRLLGRHAEPQQKVTDEEIKTLIAEAAEAGVVEHAEHDMIRGVMRLADISIEAIMTPRVDIVWLDIDTAEGKIRDVLVTTPHSRFVVSRGELDEIQGVVLARDLLAQALAGQALDVRTALQQPLFVHESVTAMKVLEQLRSVSIPVAIVVDEYGGVQGLVTATDILSSIAGALAETAPGEEPQVIQREDGSWLLDGGLPIDQAMELLKLRSLGAEITFHTLAGFMLNHLGHVPVAGEYCVIDGYRFEVVDMDGHRIDKVLVAKAEVSMELGEPL